MHNVIGHDWAVQWLRETLVNDQVRHAYCITGPANVGKMTLALGFGRALLCTAADPARPVPRATRRPAVFIPICA